MRVTNSQSSMTEPTGVVIDLQIPMDFTTISDTDGDEPTPTGILRVTSAPANGTTAQANVTLTSSTQASTVPPEEYQTSVHTVDITGMTPVGATIGRHSRLFNLTDKQGKNLSILYISRL